jgi:hypothetical protein
VVQWAADPEEVVMKARVLVWLAGVAVLTVGLPSAVAGVRVSTSGGYRSAYLPGDQLWVKRYNGPANGLDLARALGVSPDGSKVFVTGQSLGSGSGSDYATVAYDAASGAKLWSRRYNGPANADDGHSRSG